MNQEITKLKNILNTNDITNPYKVVIIPHISPDGDAAGSCSAFSQLLDKIGVAWHIVSADYFPENLLFLKNIDKYISMQTNIELCENLIIDADYIFMLDHNTTKREGLLEKFTNKSKALKIIIDHHLYPDTQDIVISHVGISSTCELLYNIIETIYGSDIIDADIANSLYCGINTDTGGFNHSSSYPEV